jgi:diphthamide synthase (EF-2-diphthine--ammonia ligase)
MAALLPKAFVSWNSGKDSAYPLLEARRQNIAEIVGTITTINTTDDHIAVHGVRPSLLTRQAAAWSPNVNRSIFYGISIGAYLALRLQEVQMRFDPEFRRTLVHFGSRVDTVNAYPA